MKFDPNKHRRRSIRLRGYDYTQPGAYFVTMCTQNRECLLGEIENGQVRLNDAGQMIARWWNELNRKFPTIKTDVSVIMPNHLHGIIVLRPNSSVGAALCGRPDLVGRDDGQPRRVAPTGEGAEVAPTGEGTGVGGMQPPDGDPVGTALCGRPDLVGRDDGQPRRVAPTEEGTEVAPTRPTLGDIIGWFKTMTTNEYIRGVKQMNWPPFPGRLWQHNYYERIVRNERELHAIRQYIVENPLKWEFDRENPAVAAREERQRMKSHADHD